MPIRIGLVPAEPQAPVRLEELFGHDLEGPPLGHGPRVRAQSPPLVRVQEAAERRREGRVITAAGRVSESSRSGRSSDTPAARVVTTGRPQAMASRQALENGS